VARINIEEKWWSDPRRTKLGQLLGNPYLSESAVVHAWRLAQEYWTKGLLVPGHIFVNLLGAYELLQTNLACLHASEAPTSERLVTPVPHIATSTDPANVQHMRTHTNMIQDGFIYLRGAHEFLSWGVQIRQKRIAAGRKSAARPRDARGRLLKKSTETQQITNIEPTNTNIVQLSGSGSGSGSNTRQETKGAQLGLMPISGKGLKANGKHSPLNENIGKFIASYVNAYKQKYDCRPSDIDDPKVIGQIQNLLKGCSIDRACQLIQVYLQIEDKWFDRKGHDFITFKANLNTIGRALDTGYQSGRTDWTKVFGNDLK
jgi:hypothetical protein